VRRKNGKCRDRVQAPVRHQTRVHTSPRGCRLPTARGSKRVLPCCGRFTARVIRKVKIQPSPKWLKDRLEASGVASISNVVDISNYVMLELGHPLHTFDYDKLRDHKIVVRRAKPGEKTRTLDGIERQLESNICMISDGDGSRAVGIGGIMGGAETEISFSTKNVLIECALFEAVAIRRAARFLKLHTEASTRFGRGADPEMADALGIDQVTLDRWKTRHKEFRSAIEHGKTQADAEIAESLFNRARGYRHEATKIFMPAGSEAPVYAPYVKHYPPDTKAALAWLSRRQPEKWKDRQEVAVTGTIAHRLAQMTPEERGAFAVSLAMQARQRLIDAGMNIDHWPTPEPAPDSDDDGDAP